MSLSPNILALPVTVPLLSAALLLAISHLGGRHSATIQKWVAAVALSINFVVSVLLLISTSQGNRLVLQMGNWPAPFGITIYCDGLSAVMLATTALLALAILPFTIGTIDYHRQRMGVYPLILFLIMGVNGAFLAGDLFNLYVFFEVLLMASFVLLTLGGTPGQINGGIRYVVLNLIASIILLIAAGTAYGTLGTLNFAQMAERLDMAPAAVPSLLAGLLLVAFGSKAAVFPLFFWLPSAYHTTHPAITALFGGVLTKVGVYTLFRTFPLLFPNQLAGWQPLLFTIAGFTMVVGVLGAFAQPTIRRLLSFHIISQIGYIIMGFGAAMNESALGVGFALGAALFFMVHNMLVKTSLLMAGGAVEMEMGSGSLDSIGGLMRKRPMLAFIFFIAAFSLAGIPPSSGFAGKLSLIQVMFDTRHYVIAGLSIAVSLLTTMSMVRLWQYSFWGKYEGRSSPSTPLRRPHSRRLVLAPTAALVVISLCFGLFFDTFFRLTQNAAAQALDRQAYIAAVAPLNEVPPVDASADLPVAAPLRATQ